jgi:hypothetical protein
VRYVAERIAENLGAPGETASGGAGQLMRRSALISG